jgi:hypothetical protein
MQMKTFAGHYQNNHHRRMKEYGDASIGGM